MVFYAYAPNYVMIFGAGACIFLCFIAIIPMLLMASGSMALPKVDDYIITSSHDDPRATITKKPNRSRQ